MFQFRRHLQHDTERGLTTGSVAPFLPFFFFDLHSSTTCTRVINTSDLTGVHTEMGISAGKTVTQISQDYAHIDTRRYKTEFRHDNSVHSAVPSLFLGSLLWFKDTCQLNKNFQFSELYHWSKYTEALILKISEKGFCRMMKTVSWQSTSRIRPSTIVTSTTCISQEWLTQSKVQQPKDGYLQMVYHYRLKKLKTKENLSDLYSSKWCYQLWMILT